MFVWIQECPQCGYCAPNIEIDIDITHTKEFIRAGRYLALKEDNRFPELARRFLCHALIVENEDREKSAIARLHAAWSCDDEGFFDSAKYCRGDVVYDYQLLLPFTMNETGVCRHLVLVDALRRSESFEEALDNCDQLLATVELDKQCAAILNLQIRLSESNDSNCYTMDDI